MRRLLALIALSTGCAQADDIGVVEPPDAAVSIGRCGDGVLDGGEQCDDGNARNDDACTSACELAACGDGIVRADVSWGQDGFEQCDDGNAVAEDACTNACRKARCGDGLVRQDKGESELGFEACDDGNASDADACLTTCLQASCGDGLLRTDLTESDEGYEQCDDGNRLDSDACTAACERARCGDGLVRLDLPADHSDFEACDDGDADDADACLSDCRVARCGDGIARRDLEPGQAGFEGCDDGNDVETDVCLSDCQVARCGDGVVRADLVPGEAGFERCDDGNDWAHDGCAACQPAGDAIHAVSVSAQGSCAHRSDGSTWCWSGAAPVRQSLPPLRQMVGDTAVLVDGRVARWVRDAAELSVVPGLHNARRIARSAGHACAVVASGRVFCWGENTQGQLGDGWVGADRGQALPVAVQRLDDAVDVVAAGSTTCALRRDQTISCWGSLSASLLSWDAVEAADPVAEPRPRPVVGAVGVIDLSLGVYGDGLGACALDEASQMRCWGGTPHTEDEVLARSRHYACGSQAACQGCMVRSTGEVFCAGSNSHGQLGVGLRGEPSTDPVNGLPPIQQVAVTTRHVCARSRGGAVYCWGSEEGLAQEAPDHHCDRVDQGRCVGEKRYAALPLQVVFD